MNVIVDRLAFGKVFGKVFGVGGSWRKILFII